jgi:hypothetical protein
MWKWRFIVDAVRFISRNETDFVRRLNKLQSFIAHELNDSAPAWTSRLTRPKQPAAHASALRNLTSAAVVLQGPLRLEDSFTVETVRLYRRTMPAAQIIVSTWEGQHADTLRAIERIGATVICSPEPTTPGSANINRQIVSTQAGLAAARESGYELALKTRTDTRINAYHVLDYLAGLQRLFPVRPSVNARGRLIILDFATRLLIPNHPSDLLMFGHLTDMEAYWAAPLCEAPSRPSQPPTTGSLWNDSTPEIYLCEHYLRRIGYAFERTIDSWWQTLAELFVVVDRASLDHFWPKYGYADEHRLACDEATRALALCTFCEWVNLHTSARKLPFSEAALRELACDGLLDTAYQRAPASNGRGGGGRGKSGRQTTAA